jgi:hypothetical protein
MAVCEFCCFIWFLSTNKNLSALIIFYRREALESIMSALKSVLPIKNQFLDRLSALDSLILQGSLLIDLSIIASIPTNIISESNYGDVSVSVVINRFEAKASIGSASFSVDLPITLPSGTEIINFAMTDASFLIDMFVMTPNPIDILQLFSDDQSNASFSLDYGGTFEANLPLSVGVAGVNIDVDLMINDPNIFEPDPVVDYAINLCDASTALMDLFEQLKDSIVSAVKEPFADKPVTFDIDRITDPLIQKVDSALANFTEGMNVTYSSLDCAQTLFPSSAPSEFPSTLPSSTPSNIPSYVPSLGPTTTPSETPSAAPSSAPSENPSSQVRNIAMLCCLLWQN